jgi:ligand-binding sensor domain-containing protein
MKQYLLTLLLCLVSLITFTQSPYIQQYTDREGVPGMVVYQVLQDDNGLIWLTTDNGIAYFDGNKFTTVTHPKMEGLDFIGLYKAPNGRIWFWNWSGQVFYLHKNKIEYYSPNGFLDKEDIASLFSDDEGNIHLGKKVLEGTYIYCSKNGECSNQPLFNAEKFPAFIELLNKNKRGKNYFCWLDYFSIMMNSKKLLGKGIISGNKTLGLLYIEQKQSNILYKVSQSQDTLTKKEIIRIEKGRSIRDVYLDNDQNIWVLSKSNLYLFDKNKTPKSINIPFVEKTVINCILQDKNGGYWMGTKGEGLIYIPNINAIIFSKENLALNSDNIVSVITDNKKTIAVTATGDIATIDNDLLSVKQDQLKTGIQLVYKRPNGKGFFMISNDKTLQVDNNFKEKNQFYWGILKSILEVNDTMYLASSTRFNRIVKSFKGNYPPNMSLTYIKEEEVTISSKNSYYALLEKGEKLYVGTLKGLFDYTKNRLYNQVNFSKNAKINASWIQDIALDSINDILWLATNKGLHGLKNDTLFQSFTTKNGLSDDNCNYIKFDKRNQIWVGTNQGVNIINTQTGEM